MGKGFAIWVMVAAIWFASIPSFAKEDGDTDTMERYAKWTSDDSQAKCQAQAQGVAGAQVTDATKAYMDACRKTYDDIASKAKDYEAEVAASEAKIQALTTEKNLCGANRSEQGQSSCLTQAADNIKAAKEAQLSLDKKLKSAIKDIDKNVKQNTDALNRLKQEQAKIDSYVKTETENANTFRQEHDLPGAAQAKQESAKAETVKSGRESAISVQKNAMDTGKKFQQEASAKAEYHRGKAAELEKMETETRASAKNLAPSPTNSGISGASGNTATPTAQPASASTAGASNPTGSESGTSNTSASSSPAATPAASGSGAAGAAAAAAPALASAAGGLSAASGSSGAGSASTPSAATSASTSAAAVQSAAGTATDAAKANGYNITTGTTANPQAPVDQAGAPVTVEATAPPVSAGGGGIGNIASGSSSSSGSYGKNSGSRSNSGGGFSSGSAAGALGKGGARTDDVASAKNFTPNLESGAVSIAGSDVKSAIASLQAELTAGDLGLDPLQPLAPMENAALAPLNTGGAPVRSLAGASDAVQGADQSMGAEDSAELFERTKSAHVRALKRGNLILGIRKKL